MTWTLNEQGRETKARRRLFGDTLLELANGLRGLSAKLDETLPWVKNQVSVPIAKLVLSHGQQPLLNCIESPRLPRLYPSIKLAGDPYELFQPRVIGLSPGRGTGLRMEHRGAIFALHGLRYDKGSGMFMWTTPWDDAEPYLRLRDWLKQDLVQVNRTTKTIKDVISEIRNQRGAHPDPKWTKDLPQPLRDFYQLYTSLFIVQLGYMLTNEARCAAANEEFNTHVFPRHGNPGEALSCPPISALARLTMERLTLGSGNEWELDLEKGVVIKHAPHQGIGTVSDTTYLWFMRAPGPDTDAEKNALIEIFQSSLPPTIADIADK